MSEASHKLTHGHLLLNFNRHWLKNFFGQGFEARPPEVYLDLYCVRVIFLKLFFRQFLLKGQRSHWIDPELLERLILATRVRVQHNFVLYIKRPQAEVLPLFLLVAVSDNFLIDHVKEGCICVFLAIDVEHPLRQLNIDVLGKHGFFGPVYYLKLHLLTFLVSFDLDLLSFNLSDGHVLLHFIWNLLIMYIQIGSVFGLIHDPVHEHISAR